MLGEIEVIVGFVSPIVTEPPNATAEPFIVIAPDPVNLELLIVPVVIAEPSIVATLKVPKVTISTTSALAKADAKITVSPDVTVTSVPLTCLTPFK